MSFDVNYFDGESSRTHKATLSVNSLAFTISYTSVNNIHKIVSWEIPAIKKSGIYTKDFISFTYGDTFPFQRIESADKNFIDYINNNEQKNLNNSLDVLLHKSKNRSIVFLLLTLITVGVATYFYIIPAVATGFATTLTEKNVIDFGDYVFRVLSTDLEINEDATKSLQEFADEMTVDSTFPLKLYVVESDEMNAFALSGGKIIVFSSLLEKIETESQLAALIGHEISHIENRHVLKNIARNFSGAIFVSVLFGDINGATAVLMDNAHMFSQLSYTRDLEKEADIFGLDIMRNSNVDLHGMPELFEILQEETMIDVPTYLSNHPMLKDRIEYTEKIANEQDEFIVNTVLQEKWQQINKTLENNNE